ncbi:TonB-dependent siderophore receptor [Novosphingobium sp. AP12]|uniref:TonB-dependent receptor plug domain-containing protein n=1 Tax=Novosphingobium sp. AP12 TaxID=1144305 RepID=UPI000271E6FF|nr:TonB-dependent receptor [Novosphingobium sp. AP12]EJL34486.1 outer membrane receptor for ferrienterochelin and colicin [Novosphingobium sp. AP12]
MKILKFVALVASVSFLPFAAHAEDAAADAGAAADAEGGAIIVTGARGQVQRSVADSPVPVDVIGPQELKSTGRTGLKEILGNIIPSLTMPALGGGGTSASVRPISIRGLSGDYVLVLVNGKRRHTTSLINNLSRISGGSTPVDIDLIPTSGVGRIEVLRDGAAAQYGSDAISGVINVILDDSATGGDLSLTGGSLYSKGGELAQVSASYGTRLGDDGGFVRFALEAKYHDRAKSSAEPIPYIYPLVNGQPDPREASADHLIAGGYGRSNRDKIVNTSYNAELPLGEDTTLYSFSTLSYRDIKDARGASVAAATGFGGQANTQGASVLPQIYPGGFQAYRRIKEWDYQAALGVRTALAGWDFDLSTSYGKDNVELGAENTLNPSLGPTSPTDFFMGRQKQDLWVTNLDVSRAYDIGLAKPLNVAFGAEYRWERFQNIAGEPDSYRDGGYVIPVDDTPFGQLYGGRSPSPGLVSFTGTSPADETSLSRNNLAAYLDLSTDVTPGWFVGVAGRFEHYSDSAGDTFSAKASTRIELAPGLALRGGVNTGFRAPSLAQTGFSTTQNTVTVIGDERVLTVSKFLPVNSAAAQALGASPLKPEKSLNFTAGVTYESGPLRLTIDAYQIRIDDRIVKTEFLGTASNGGAAIKSILEANGVDDVDSAQFFTNAIDTRTRGVDVVGEYTLDTSAAGTFRLSAAYSYNKTKILHVIDNPPELSDLNVTLFGRQAQRDLVAATPRSKVVLTTNWSSSPVRALVRATRYGEYTESSNVAASDRTFGARWIADAEIGYQLTEALDLSVGANNLFDTYPEKNGAVAFDGSGLYGGFAPFGLSGGFYYARVGLKF